MYNAIKFAHLKSLDYVDERRKKNHSIECIFNRLHIMLYVHNVIIDIRPNLGQSFILLLFSSYSSFCILHLSSFLLKINSHIKFWSVNWICNQLSIRFRDYLVNAPKKYIQHFCENGCCCCCCRLQIELRWHAWRLQLTDILNNNQQYRRNIQLTEEKRNLNSHWSQWFGMSLRIKTSNSSSKTRGNIRDEFLRMDVFQNLLILSTSS